MNRFHRTAAAVASAAVALVGLAGCAGGSADSGSDGTDRAGRLSGSDHTLGQPGWDGQLLERTLPLDDGRKVICVIYAGDRQGGLSCDWDHPVK